MNITPNIIIGAGPAGLAVAGRMKQNNVPFRILEQSQNIANSWHQHYDRLHLHTIKSLSHLPGMKFPSDYPTYVPRKKLIEYYQGYTKHFNIEPDLDMEVISVKRNEDVWHVKTNKESLIAKSVIFATGINRKPFCPNWPGKEKFEGTILHSSKYKNPNPFNAKKVLVIGMGNTGAEIAFDLSENNVETYLSVRSPVNIVPRDINGNPVQSTSKILAKLPFGNWIGKKVAELVIGDLSSYGLEMSKDYPVKQLMETGKTPIIDIGTVKNIKNGKIKILPDLKSFKKNKICFIDEREMPFDAVILATGYRAGLEDFIINAKELFDDNHYPKSPIATGKFKGLYFVGFDNYKLGGVLGTILTDSRTVVEEIVKGS